MRISPHPPSSLSRSEAYGRGRSGEAGVGEGRRSTMKHKTSILGLTLLSVLLVMGAALAEANTGYDIPWWTVDGGGVSAVAPVTACRARPASRR